MNSPVKSMEGGGGITLVMGDPLNVGVVALSFRPLLTPTLVPDPIDI